jgi:1,4-dihydroxy-2-naphthoyl-CoA synthase
MQAAYASIDRLGLTASLDMVHFPLVDLMMNGEDAWEGKKAFAEKRAPVWQGK